MADVYRFRASKKNRAYVLPSSLASAVSLLGLPFGQFSHFSLHLRRKTKNRERHYEVWLRSDGREGKIGLNLSHIKNVFLKTEQEARNYVTAFAHGQGMHLTEVMRKEPKRSPRASREDAALLKQGVVKEEWLESDVPTLWAEAMVRCQHPAGYCGQDGFCHYGDCKMIMKPVEPQAVEAEVD